MLGIYYSDEEILGENATVDLAFDENTQKVSSVSISFKNENEEIYKKVSETLTNDLGSPTTKEAGGEDTQYKETWQKDNSTGNIIRMGQSTNITIE
ncbi:MULTISPECIES: hypothetical protein [unclassified Clostridium]|uniref:hypothetical protein n=1 Tax=unclassified Clostridium TaxID=2614128 RepID=UPI001C8CA040|nr:MULTISPECIES: hypothetical protein [unclassified Clostridium]MBX9139125.1 hypothetical protein [Clostridium sp. K12(2020)]MBX9145906.1 hypothetical protein [Clostridium sp. K13]